MAGAERSEAPGRNARNVRNMDTQVPHNPPYELEPSSEEMASMLAEAGRRVAKFIAALPEQPAEAADPGASQRSPRA